MGYHQRNLGIIHERMDKDRVPMKSGGFWIILDHEIVVTVIQMIQCHWDKIGICLGYITIYLQHYGDDAWECRFDHRASHARFRCEFV